VFSDRKQQYYEFRVVKQHCFGCLILLVDLGFGKPVMGCCFGYIGFDSFFLFSVCQFLFGELSCLDWPKSDRF